MKRIAAAVLSLLTAGSLLTSCAGDKAESSTVDVPILWVTVGENGPTGGVSTANVTVNLTGSTSSYSVDLHASESADTGDTWDAAAAMASTVAVLYSGQDPRGVHTQVGVRDAIDGSSAGGVLTVAVLAALRHAPINPRVAMTGTVGPDGSIGSVDGVEAKVRAAAARGYTTILVPPASVRQSSASASASASASVSATASAPSQASPAASGTDTTGTDTSGLVDAKALAAELGVTVTPVQDVGQAMLAFTGQSVAPAASPMPALTAEAQALLRTQAARAVAEAGARLRGNRSRVGTATAKQAGSSLAKASRQLAAGDNAGAYAAAVGTTIVLEQAIATSVTTPAAAKDGTAASRAVLAEADALIERARAQLRQHGNVGSSEDPVRRYATVSAMTWLTRTIAVVGAVAKELAALQGAVADSIVEAATVVAQFRVYVDLLYPDSFAVAQLHTVDGGADARGVESFLAAYTELLAGTGAANQRYYEKVLTTIADNPGLTFSQPGHTYAAVQQLQAIARPSSASAAASTSTASTSANAPSTVPSASTTASSTEPAASATASSTESSVPPPPPASTDEACAWAMSYFLMSSWLVASDQSFGLSGSGIGSLVLTSRKPAALRAGFRGADEATSAFAAHLEANGVLTDHPVWTGDWASRLPEAFAGQDVETGMASFGITVLWDAAVESFMNTASLDAKSRSNRSSS